MRSELENKDSRIMTLNREIFLRNREMDEDKENNGGVDSNRKRYSYNSNVLNTLLSSDNINKSLFKTGVKRKHAELPNGSLPEEYCYSSKKMKL
jgi:hypothetical protein